MRPALFALIALALLATGAVLGPRAALPWSALPAVACAALAVPAVRRAPGPGARIAVLAACLLAAILTGLLWQPVMILALAAFALVARAVPGLRRTGAPLRAGRVPVPGTLACAAVTPVGLLAWHVLARPDLSDVVDAYVPAVPLALLLLGGVLFALVNAALEEVIWRGLLQDDLGALLGPAAAVAVQGASFGLAHAHGVPRGLAGVVLAGGWGVLLGWLRLRSGGLLAPILAHVVADATIATIVLLIVRGGGP